MTLQERWENILFLIANDLRRNEQKLGKPGMPIADYAEVRDKLIAVAISALTDALVEEMPKRDSHWKGYTNEGLGYNQYRSDLLKLLGREV